MGNHAHGLRTALLSAAAVFATVACLTLMPTFGHTDMAYAASTSKGKTPAKASVSKLSSTEEGKITVKVKKEKGAKGYQVKASQSKNYKGKTTKAKKSKNPTITIGKLTQNKTYYVKARSYAKSKNGKVKYSAWSDSKSVRVKGAAATAESGKKPVTSTPSTDTLLSAGAESPFGKPSDNMNPPASGGKVPSSEDTGAYPPDTPAPTTPAPATPAPATPGDPAQGETAPTTPQVPATDPLTVEPNLVRIETTGYDELKAYVQKIDNASGYELQVSQSSSFVGSTTKSTKSASPAQTSFSSELLEMPIDKLAANSLYYARFRVYKNTGNGTAYGNWSSSLSLRTCLKIDAPEIISMTFNAYGKGRVQVSKVPNAASPYYNVEACTSPEFDSTTIKNITLDEENFAYFQDSRLPKLEAGKTWYIRACAEGYNEKFYAGAKTWSWHSFPESNYYNGAWSTVKVIYIKSLDEYVNDVKSYNYTIRPVNGKLNNIIFVETDNPDPMSIQLIDENSKYLASGKTATFKPLGKAYRDILYSNEETLRIADKGYLFFCYNCDSDGGALKLMANIGQYKTATNDNYNGTNYETGRTVYCQTLEDRADYLIRTYAAGKTDFFSKLDAVQSGLDKIAIYPKRLYDSDKPTGYAHFSQQRYPELSLKCHTADLFEVDEEGIFLTAVYGFTLDSLGVPGMMTRVAQRLEPTCTVTNGTYHYQIMVTYGGTTKMYGGGGTGGTTPFYSEVLEKTFRFDGTDYGYGTNLSLDTLRAKYMEYVKTSNALADAYDALLDSDEICRTVGDGCWVSVKSDTDSTSMKQSYFMTDARGHFTYASNAWVDGRYVGPHEIYVAGAKFEDHPTASIVLKNVSYVDVNGKRHCGTVTFSYYSSKDCWMAPFNYFDANSYSLSDLDKVPSSLILTRAQVEAMVNSGQIDGNTNTPPTVEYLYDGTAAPGTRA